MDTLTNRKWPVFTIALYEVFDCIVSVGDLNPGVDKKCGQTTTYNIQMEPESVSFIQSEKLRCVHFYLNLSMVNLRDGHFTHLAQCGHYDFAAILVILSINDTCFSNFEISSKVK